jgi:hypothetical protein
MLKNKTFTCRNGKDIVDSTKSRRKIKEAFKEEWRPI